MTFETERLILRPWAESDAEECFKYAQDPDVGPAAGWPVHKSVEQSRIVIRDVLMVPETYAIVLKETGLPIGSIGLHHNDLAARDDELELGYWLGKPYWGRGLVPEAAREVIRHAFADLKVARLWCGYYDGNVKSKRVQEKLGFRYQWTSENVPVPQMGETRRGFVNMMTREEWLEMETLRYYKEQQAAFVAGTLNADMEETRKRFLAYLAPGARILDFGCGSGRDTKAFLDLGYRVDATDGSEEICELASKFTGIEVVPMHFSGLCAIDVYHGIWACASILHLPKAELKSVLAKIATALKEGGILYTSFKYGTFEGMRNGRCFTDFTSESLADFWKDIESLKIVEEWITTDVRPGREDEKWINILARKS